MEPLTALLIAPLLIWAGVFAFVWSLDRRVRDLERRLSERRSSSVGASADGAARTASRTETVSR